MNIEAIIAISVIRLRHAGPFTTGWFPIKITESWLIESIDIIFIYKRGSAWRLNERLKPLVPSGPLKKLLFNPPIPYKWNTKSGSGSRLLYRGSRRTASWRMRKLVDFSESEELTSDVKTELDAELTDLPHVRVVS